MQFYQSFVQAIVNSCSNPNIDEDEDPTENVDASTVETPVDPVLTHKQRMLAVKDKYQLSDKTLSEYRFIFQRFDDDNNGTLDNMEIRNVLHFWKQDPTDGELKLIIEKYDDDKNGFIEFPEFISMLEDRKISIALEEEYKQRFKKYDTNGDGFISKKELLNGLKKFDDMQCSSEEVEKLMKMVNKDENGALNYDNLIKLLRYEGILK